MIVARLVAPGGFEVDGGACDPEIKENECDVLRERLLAPTPQKPNLFPSIIRAFDIENWRVKLYWLANEEPQIEFIDGTVSAKHEIRDIDRSVDGPENWTYRLLLISVAFDT